MITLMAQRPAGGRRAGGGSGQPEPWLVASVRARLADGVVPASAAGVVSAVEAVRSGSGTEGVLALAGPVRAALSGAGPLQPLLDDPAVTDVLVNGPGQVWVDAGRGLRRVDVDVGREADVRALAVRLAVGCGRRLDESRPYN